jgi:hypothetical protein
MNFKLIFRTITVIAGFTFISGFLPARSQVAGNFPFDPYAVLKSWNYDLLVKNRGEGEQIMGKIRNQSYIAGLSYQADLLGMTGKLEYFFNKDSISRIQFRKEHPVRVVGSDVEDRLARDTTFRKEYNRGILTMDSLRRDSVVQAITGILGLPHSSGPTAATEKNARYSAIWTNQGYSCMYKDYLTYSEIVFTLSRVPLWTVGEFEIPAGTEIISKIPVKTRKMSWTASMLGYPATSPMMTYSDYFILLEFSTGKRYLESVPKNPINFLTARRFLDLPAGQRIQLDLPLSASGYLPDLIFEDCDGDAIPEAWIRITADPAAKEQRHLLYALPVMEPNLILNSDDLLPTKIVLKKGSGVMVTFHDGTTREVESPVQPGFPVKPRYLNPNGFRFLKIAGRNTDGSVNFTGGIDLDHLAGKSGTGILEITFRHVQGGWEADEIRIVPAE